MVEPYLIACGVLLLGSVLARALPVSRRSFDSDHEDGWDLAPRELAYLRRGAYGVVLTVLAHLHGDGVIDLGRARVERNHRDRAAHASPTRHTGPAPDDELAEAVCTVLPYVRHPRLVALFPRVRRACAPLRGDLRERGLLPPLRRRLFAAALLVYAGGLATATALESGLRGSTVAGAVGVWGAAALLALGPRRTVAGARELASHRRALARVAVDLSEAEYLLDLVAAYGPAALRVLGGQVPAGALARPASASEPSPAQPTPTVQPAPVPVDQPAPTLQPAPVPADQPMRAPAPPQPRPAPGYQPWPAVGAPVYLRPVLVPVPPPAVPEFPVVELPVRRHDRLPVAA